MFCHLDFRCYFQLMVKITSIFGSYRFLRIAWHDIFALSHHLLASWNLYIPRVAESKSKCSSSRQKRKRKEDSKSEQRTMHSLTHRTSPCFYLSCSWRNTLWLSAMHCGKKWWIREFIAPYIFPLNPDSVLLLAPCGRSAAIKNLLNGQKKKFFSDSCSTKVENPEWAKWIKW